MTDTLRRPRSAPSLTPTVGQATRRIRFWFGFAAIALAFVVIALIVRGAAVSSADVTLAADNAAPDGARALVQVLDGHGVRVTAADSLGAAERAIAAHPHATVFVYDPQGYLDGDRLRTLAGLGARTVLVAPSPEALRVLAPGIRSAGIAKQHDDLAAECTDPTARRAGTLTAPGTAYRASGVAQGCFATGSDTFATASVTTQGHRVTVIGSDTAFDNEHIVRAGNAAYALGVLGASPSVVWYLPTQLDAATTGPPSLAELTPGWVTPVIVLLMAAAAAAIAWRGHRFGPLVTERLPVTVHARETMEGRGRLYQRSSARLRALDSLRVGALGRLAEAMALPSTADAGEVADAVAALLGRAPIELRRLLLEAEPADDAELMRLSDGLAELETATRAALSFDIGADRPHSTRTTRPTRRDGRMKP